VLASAIARLVGIDEVCVMRESRRWIHETLTRFLRNLRAELEGFAANREVRFGYADLAG
jgi:hypothetical protein